MISKKHTNDLTTALAVRSSANPIPSALKNPLREPELETWFVNESKKRLRGISSTASFKEKQDKLEMPNRYPNGSMRPIELSEMLTMKSFIASSNDVLNRAKEGAELLSENARDEQFGTAARGIPGGGASSRAAKWTRLNPELARKIGITETTPRPLFRVGNKTLLQHTLDFSQDIARRLGKIFPNLVMTNSENVNLFLDTIKHGWESWTKEELENTILFNQIVLPRMWVSDQTINASTLYPAGHGDYPYLLAKYGLAKTLRDSGIKYFVFSNADEWLWQADPVMISIAQELFDQGHHMVIIGTENTNNQFGGGFVKMKDGTQSLVETPRLPWDIVAAGQAPVALNTTFYMIDVEYLADDENKLLNVEKSLVVKEVPGRKKGEVEQIIGVDSWAGDVFAAILNPAFIQWSRLNFLGIKDGGFIAGTEPVAELEGRSYTEYLNETITKFPAVMEGLLEGNKETAKKLHEAEYCYINS